MLKRQFFYDFCIAITSYIYGNCSTYDLVRWGYYHNSLVQVVNTATLSASVQLLNSVEDKSKKKALSSALGEKNIK